jgi:hypothetical protein
MSALPGYIRHQLAPLSRARHPLRFRDSALCFQFSCGQARAGRPEDCRYAGRSVSPLSVATNACRTASDRVQCCQSIRPRGGILARGHATVALPTTREQKFARASCPTLAGIPQSDAAHAAAARLQRRSAMRGFLARVPASLIDPKKIDPRKRCTMAGSAPH